MAKLESPPSDELIAHVAMRVKEMDDLAEEVFSDPETVAGLEAGLADIEAGRVTKWQPKGD